MIKCSLTDWLVSWWNFREHISQAPVIWHHILTSKFIYLKIHSFMLHFSFLGFPPYCSSFQDTACLVLHNPANVSASLWLLLMCRKTVTNFTRWITASADWCFTADCGVTVGFTLSWLPLHSAVRTSVHQARVRCRSCWLHTHLWVFFFIRHRLHPLSFVHDSSSLVPGRDVRFHYAL